MKHRGRPIRGAIAGFFFGLFLSLDLLIFGVVATDSNILALMPIVGLAAGIALGLSAPLKRRTAPLERRTASAAVEASPPIAPPDALADAPAPQDPVPATAEPNPTTV